MIRTRVLKRLRGAGKGKREGSEGDVRKVATARGTAEKSGGVRVIEKRRSGITQLNFLTRV